MKKFFSLLLVTVMLLSACGPAVGIDTTEPDVTKAPEITNPPESDSGSETTETPIETDAPVKVERMDYKIIVKDDTYVYNNDGTVDYSDKNFGKDIDLQIKSNKSSLTRYAYLKFDISSLVGDTDFTAIELDLMLKSKQSMPGNPEYATVEIYSVDPKGWSEDSVTFNNRPEYVDLVASRDDIKDKGFTFSFPVTSYIKQALENGETEVAFYINDASGVPLHIKFESKESGMGVPALAVYYGTKTDDKIYSGKMWGFKEPELSKNGIDNIVGLRKSELSSVEVVEDTFVEAGTSADKNFGGNAIVDFKAAGSFIDGTYLNNYYRISLLKFDISKLGDLKYKTVELELNSKTIEKGDIPVQVNVYACSSDEWSEMKVTYNTVPKRGELISTEFARGVGHLRLDVTDYIKKCISNGDKYVSFYLEGEKASTRRIQFTSRESGLGTSRLVFNDETTGKGFATYLPYKGVNPWDNAMEMVSNWINRWDNIKKGGDSGVELIARDNSEYSLVVDATDNTHTKGANTVYDKYPTRTVSTLKGYNASTAKNETSLYDEYGGYMGGAKYEATGYFYTKKVGDRWWTIDPLGYPFFRVACVTITPGNATQSAQTLAKYGTYEKWAQATTDRLKALGFNSAGGWSNISYLSGANEPLSQTYVMYVLRRYCQNLGLDVTTGGNTALLYDVMPVFDPAFVSSANSNVKSIVSPHANASYVYGWMSDNELPQSLQMLDSTMALDTNDNRFIYSYAVAWTFMYMKTGKANVSAADVTDELRREFRAMVYDRYFEVIKGALDEHVPNHLYMGCRFLKGCYSDEYVMRVAGYWCDIITYNYYNAWEADPQLVANQQKWAGKPFVVTEWYAKGMDVWEKDNRMTNTTGAGWTVRTQNDRGLFYHNFALQLLECKGCVGFDWFLYRDNDPSDPTADLSNRDSNKGIISNSGEEYTDLTKHMGELNNQKYTLINFFDAR